MRDRWFSPDRSAVSAVVGVVVLVAITVVFATVLAITWQRGTEEQTNKAPAVGFTQDPLVRTLKVAAAEPDVWTAVRYTWGGGSDSACSIRLNGDPPGTAVGGPPVSGVVGAIPGQLIEANDVLAVVGPVAGSGAACHLLLTHLPQNESYGSWTFHF